ncbi:hypothetical protein Ciccas_012335 [Cichlidogyrus casuarinus]|uniref:Uncharacterized protein n=1 Tax=Cichlidogyrus casuarinus TaxID=1844966 RepID=A0ABD2PNT3_9PLAT
MCCYSTCLLCSSISLTSEGVFGSKDFFKEMLLSVLEDRLMAQALYSFGIMTRQKHETAEKFDLLSKDNNLKNWFDRILQKLTKVLNEFTMESSVMQHKNLLQPFTKSDFVLLTKCKNRVEYLVQSDLRLMRSLEQFLQDARFVSC